MVSGGHATIRGSCADDSERRVVAAMARTIPGVDDVRIEDAPATTAGR
ncbi:hypothetical protein [Nocardia sp. NPDC003345]